jgi:hypothetical protein
MTRRRHQDRAGGVGGGLASPARRIRGESTSAYRSDMSTRRSGEPPEDREEWRELLYRLQIDEEGDWSPDIVLSWDGVNDVVRFSPENGVAWDLPNTRRAWSNGIYRAGSLFTVAAIFGVLRGIDSWGRAEAVIVLVTVLVIAGVFAARRQAQRKLLKSQPWQVWLAEPARLPRLGGADGAPLLRVRTQHLDGSTTTALLRSTSSRRNRQVHLVHSVHWVLLLPRTGGRAFAARADDDSQLMSLRLPRTVAEHERWAEAFDE